MARVRWIDVARGIGIILVVAGHSLVPDGLPNQIIFAFHMPLFFVLSGYVFGLTERAEAPISRTLGSGVRRLLIPYAATGVVAYLYWFFILRFQTHDLNAPLVILGIFAKTFGYGAGAVVAQFPDVGPVGPMWFLLALFLGQAILWVLLRLRRTPVLMWVAAAAVSGLGIYLGQRLYLPWSLDIALGIQIFMLAGWEAARRRLFDRGLSIRHMLLLLAIFAVDVYAGGLSLNNRQYGIIPLSIAGALAGCWLVIELSKRLAVVPWLERALGYLGTISLAILCYHTMDTGFFHWDWIAPISFLFVPGLALFALRMFVTVPIAWFVTSVPGLRWFYGYRRRKRARPAARHSARIATEEK